jgi:hypothetical protein
LMRMKIVTKRRTGIWSSGCWLGMVRPTVRRA